MPQAKNTTKFDVSSKAAYFDAMRQFRLPRYEELPEIELYMDQMLGYLEERVDPLLISGEKPLTSSMVNNYVKQKVVPRPEAKKYNQSHIAYLIVVAILKQSFSISEIVHLIKIQIETTDSAQAYDSFCVAFEKTLHIVFADVGQDIKSDPSAFIPVDEPEGPRRLMLATIVSVICRLYVAKMLEFDQ